MMRALVLVLFLCAGPVMSEGAAEYARDAAQQLVAARQLLNRVDGAQDRVAALTTTVQAYENGLSAARQGLRVATIRETQLSGILAIREVEITQLLGALQGISRAGSAETVLHPEGPLGTVRAGMMISGLTPALAAQASDLRSKITEIASLRQLRRDIIENLQAGLVQVQTARLALSQAVAARTNLPMKYAEDPVRMALLANDAQTLDQLATALQMRTGDTAAQADISARRGQLAWPALGTIVRRPEEADAAGVRRPGIVFATEPKALVMAPAASTLRFRGPMQGQGMVAILEPAPDLLIILTGMARLFGTLGEVLPKGAPVGLMGDTLDATSQSRENTGVLRSETLYIEIRQDGVPVDPLTWFEVKED